MNCLICKIGETQSGTTTVTLEKGKVTFVFKEVPADVCVNCGEEYISESVSEKILKGGAESQKSGVQVSVKKF
jgi:YgiT-type zinc finger domain-containing protein